MLIAQQFRSEPHDCLYLPGQVAEMEYTAVAALDGAEYLALMDRGYRKFGPLVFRPVCAACAACRPIRVPVARFVPSASQRRALKRNRDLEVRVGAPRVDAARLELYSRYHLAQAARRGWPATDKSADEYEFSFVRNPLPAAEISAWEGDALRAVVLVDVVPGALSDVYHYHDPDASDRGLGTFVLLETLALARRLDRAYVYLGYYVAGCRSMVYKARFRPCELLDTDGVWREFRSPDNE
jgi:arginine-tRNA-protein transferase